MKYLSGVNSLQYYLASSRPSATIASLKAPKPQNRARQEKESDSSATMPMSTECLTKTRRELLAVAEALKLSREQRRGLICVECSRRVIPHAASKGGVQAAHFEHFRRNSRCSLSDKRIR
jgi:hypothetical protein